MQNRKVLDTVRIADLVNETLSPMVRWVRLSPSNALRSDASASISTTAPIRY